MNILENQKTVFSYRKNKVYSGDAVYPDGNSFKWTTLDIQDSVSILPITEDGKFVLIKQYRPPVKDWCIEQPAGGIEEGSSLKRNALREIKEEIGYDLVKDDLQYLKNFYFIPGVMNFQVHFYLAHCSKSKFVGPNPEQSELIEPMIVDRNELIALVRNNYIVDPEIMFTLFLMDMYYHRNALDEKFHVVYQD